jgi:hypothetical protein
VAQRQGRALPDGTMVSTDIGNICPVSNSYLRFDPPRSMFAPMSFGNCGYAFPTIVAAIRALCARSKRTAELVRSVLRALPRTARNPSRMKSPGASRNHTQGSRRASVIAILFCS